MSDDIKNITFLFILLSIAAFMEASVEYGYVIYSLVLWMLWKNRKASAIIFTILTKLNSAFKLFDQSSSSIHLNISAFVLVIPTVVESYFSACCASKKVNFNLLYNKPAVVVLLH